MSWAIWITGPPGSGKTTLARSTAAALHARSIHAEVLQLDEIQKVLTPEPTDSEAEHEVVYRALVYMAALLSRAGVPVIVDATAHRRAWRSLARTLIPIFAEVQLRCPHEVCRERAETRHAGQENTTAPGVEAPYEETPTPELTLQTETINLARNVQEVVYVARRLQRHAAWLCAHVRHPVPYA